MAEKLLSANDIRQLTSNDYAVITNKVTGSDGLVNLVSLSSRIPITGTCTYNASNKINVSSGAASIYCLGDKITVTQATGGTKYGYIVGIADTVLTIIGFTVNNEAITAPYFSHGNMVGHPVWLDYDPVVYGTSGTIGSFAKTIYKSKFFINNHVLFWSVVLQIINKGLWGGDVRISVPVLLPTGSIFITQIALSPFQQPGFNDARGVFGSESGGPDHLRCNAGHAAAALQWSAVVNNDWIMGCATIEI